MKAFKQNNFFIFIYLLLILKPFFVSGIKIFAKDFSKNYFSEIGTNLDSKVRETQKISSSVDFSKEKILEDLNENGKKLLNLLAFEQKDLEDEYFVEILSDTQYRENEYFKAEGNAIIYLSDASLKGDLITYDTQKKLLTVTGNVIFKKGEQYFEASKLFYDLNNDSGYINDVYGLLDSKSFTEDFNLELNQNNIENINPKIEKKITQPNYTSSATVGLVNEFKDAKSLNITKVNLILPSISRWRYKTEKLIYNSETLESEKIFFTNDIYNKPQFVFLSKKFSAEIIENKLRLISRNSWIILDDKLKIPIGRRSVFDEDPITAWGLGADFKEKDGYFVYRSTYPKKIFKDYSLQFQPYFLLQRGIQGYSKSFRAKDASIFSSKVNSDIKLSDLFALDINLKGKENNWDIDSQIKLNSLNTDRLSESLRTKITFTKRIDLDAKTDFETQYKDDEKLNNFLGFVEDSEQIPSNNEFKSKVSLKKKEKSTTNFLDFQFYNIFREKVIKDFATEEIYFASGVNLTNKRSGSTNNNDSNLSLIFDTGHFKSKSLEADVFKDLFRNAFVAQYNYKFPIWKKSNLDKNINESYKFTPSVILQSIDWSSGVQSGLFLYSDGSNQNALKFNTGPILTLGSLKRKFFDYTYFNADLNYVFKGGESPFSFDNINKEPRINLNFEQQIIGPLIFSFRNSYNLESGDFSPAYYALDIKRRAYSLGAFYNSPDESLGIRFNIFNFDYSGLSPKF